MKIMLAVLLVLLAGLAVDAAPPRRRVSSYFLYLFIYLFISTV